MVKWLTPNGRFLSSEGVVALRYEAKMPKDFIPYLFNKG
jgi:hypothetical protein